jgi:hypothetical protein
MVNMRMATHTQLTLDPTIEYQRMGAVRGIILNGDGSTLYNLFTEFNVAQPTEVAFDLANNANGVGAQALHRRHAHDRGAMGGHPLHRRVRVLLRRVLGRPDQERGGARDLPEPAGGLQLRAGVAYQTLNFGGITFENYRGSVGTTSSRWTDKAHFFPFGVPGLWRTAYAPADYVETVNTIGLPRYAKIYPMDNGKGVSMEVQTNAAFLLHVRPGALVQGKRGA